MASSLSFAVLAMLACLFAITYSQEMGGLTAGEKQACEDLAKANNKQLAQTMKDRRLSCNVICKYEDGTEDTTSSPDGQRCCDVGGGLPTGTCKDGKCQMGGGMIG